MSSTSATAAPHATGDKNFRLDPAVRPQHYRFVVAPDLAGKTFSASGTVRFINDHPRRTIVLHGVNLTIVSARLDGAHDGAVTADAVSQTLTFDFPVEIPAGPHALELTYGGVFNDDLRGLYLGGEIAVTQFEAADARRVFPCFDEPAFKAPWQLSIETIDGPATISNGAIVAKEKLENGRIRVRFAETPTMSSYLVALIVGPLVGTEPVTIRGVPIRTWSVLDKARLSCFGQTCAVAALPLLEDYFGCPYAFGKLDQVGIPDFEAGAMENSGCVTFREVALLLDDETAPLSQKKRVAEVVTHELAHQWFGNLVTMRWWDDLWLNEAFATWMAAKIVDQWRPEWRVWDDFDAGKAAALSLDAMESTHPIRAEVMNAEQATENFDLITYEKGGAFLRMVEGYLGADAFRDGIRAYMRDFAYKNAIADDLWGALGRASGQPIVDVAAGWLGRGGFPGIRVDHEKGVITLSQRRFFSDPARLADGRTVGDPWPVPMVLRWADDEGVHEERLLLCDRMATVRLDPKGTLRYLCANQSGAGFYRVLYSQDLIAGLSRHGAELRPIERINLCADAWALFRAGAGPLSSLLDLLVAFAGDPDYAVLAEVVGRFEMLERRFVAPADRARLRRFVAELFAPRLAQLGWDAAAGDSDDVKLSRAAAVRALVLVARSPDAVVEAKRRQALVMAGDRAALDPNLLDAAAIATARDADDNLVDALLAKVRSETDPATRRRWLVSLATVETEALHERTIELFSTDVVPMQDSSTYLGALLGNRAAQDRAWAFITSHWAEVAKKAAAPMLMRRVVESFGELCHRRAEVEQFLDEKPDFAAQPQAVRQTRERLRLDEDVARRATPELSAWLLLHA